MLRFTSFQQAFVCDLTQPLSLLSNVPSSSVDVISVIFVLSAIDPLKHSIVVNNLAAVLSPGGRILFRDYGLYDQAQLRFKRGHKIQDNFYKRQDGTRCYYFEVEKSSRARPTLQNASCPGVR